LRRALESAIYTPIETEFLKAAAARGARTLNGSGMCVHQAVEAFTLFTGVKPNVARLHRAFAKGLASRGLAGRDLASRDAV